MVISLKHKFQSGVADSTAPSDNTKIKPSHWNSEHELTLSQPGYLIGRTTPGPGPAEDIPIADFATAAQGARADTAVQPADIVGLGLNAFINGSFDVWQRRTDDTGVTTTRKYVADRFAVKTGAGTLAHVQRSTTVRTGARTKYSMRLDGATGVTTVDIDQRIESIHVPILKRTVTFSAWVYNGSGAAFTPTLFVSTPAAENNWSTPTVQNNAGDGDSLQSCADSAWTKVTWTADLSGYANVDNGLEFRLRIPSGSLMASSIVRLAEWKIEIGSIATDFIPVPFSTEYNLCCRYFQKSCGYDLPVQSAASAGDFRFYVPVSSVLNSDTYGVYKFDVPLRSIPTLLLWPYTTPANTGRSSNVLGADYPDQSASAFASSTLLTVYSNASSALTVVANVIIVGWSADAEL